MHEFELIERIRARSGARADVVLGIGDDAAVLAPPVGRQLVATADTLVRGAHYPPDTPPADLGWKALAVNLSDLAAMGAEPAWVLLALTRESADAGWLDDFLEGWCALAQASGIALVGGDTTRGPESITVTALGTVPVGTALTRAGARIGDRIWVSGTLGDAAAALRDVAADTAVDDADATWLLQRLRRPPPRLALGSALRGVARACIDVSDGLLADLGHIVAASAAATGGELGAELQVAALPTSHALAKLQDAERWPLQLAGGDDYELCFTAPAACDHAVRVAAARAGTSVTAIGRIVAATGVRALHEDGSELHIAHRGYQHFAL